MMKKTLFSSNDNIKPLHINLPLLSGSMKKNEKVKLLSLKLEESIRKHKVIWKITRKNRIGFKILLTKELWWCDEIVYNDK